MQGVAATQQSGAQCPHCSHAIAEGELFVCCQACGALQHQACWESYGGCGSYDCAPARRTDIAGGNSVLRITGEELEQAMVAAPDARSRIPAIGISAPAINTADRRNGLATASVVIALLGIVLFGIVTGLVAIVVGSVALGKIRDTHERGTGLAVAGVILGLADVVGWLFFLSMTLFHSGSTLTSLEFEPDVAAFEDVDPKIARAMRANVLVTTGGGLFRGRSMGSGVILRIDNGEAWIITNRHVVAPGSSSTADAEGAGATLRVKVIGQPLTEARVAFRAPEGIDCVILLASCISHEAEAASWRSKPAVKVGADAFAIGNPHGLGWTHTRGSISQLRTRMHSGRSIRVIQTSTAINPGNSGGGLYDDDGMLIGINTWTNDKRSSEGLSFALSFHSLLEVLPDEMATALSRQVLE